MGGVIVHYINTQGFEAAVSEASVYVLYGYIVAW